MPEFSSPLPPLDRCVAIVGMNGVGKSAMGKQLAKKLKMKRIDTDQMFRDQHGDHHAFIQAQKWPAFRTAEEVIVLQSLLPNHIVVLGGGAIESSAVREALNTQAIVVWIQGGRKQIHRLLQQARKPRPEFRNVPMKAAIDQRLELLTPLYQAAADILLPPEVKFANRIPVTIELLKEFLKNEHQG